MQKKMLDYDEQFVIKKKNKSNFRTLAQHKLWNETFLLKRLHDFDLNIKRYHKIIYFST